MNYYGAKDLAASFRTVRKNTLIIADDIPEDQYGFRPADDSMTVAELLTHMAFGGKFAEQVILVEKRSSMVGFDFMKFVEDLKADREKTRSKTEIVALLQEEGEKFARALESLDDDFLGEIVAMPPGAPRPGRSRFDILMGVKEHEMHHRGQLMLIERMLGIVPHMTRENQARMAAMRAAKTQTAPAS